jgi:hypothetical protein
LSVLPRAIAVAAACIAGVGLTGCIPMAQVRYAAEAPGTQPRFEQLGACGGPKLSTAVSISAPEARMDVSVEEHSGEQDFEVVLDLRLAQGAVAEVKQSTLELKAPDLPAPLVLSARLISHRELDGKKLITQTQPISQPIDPAQIRPSRPPYSVDYFIRYLGKGKFPAEFSVATPLIEINRVPMPQTTVTFRRQTVFSVTVINC